MTQINYSGYSSVDNYLNAEYIPLTLPMHKMGKPLYIAKPLQNLFDAIVSGFLLPALGKIINLWL